MESNFSEHLRSSLQGKHLLQHPFYQEWSEGTLSKDILQSYARQYYQHVKEFPRWVSAIHSNCTAFEDRQVLLDNLIDEEKDDHPGLWRQFGRGLGESDQSLENEPPIEETMKLISTFERLARSSYAEGLGALFAYEQQAPDIAKEKIRGLREFYGMSDEKDYEFFSVHGEVDVEHTAAVAGLLDKLPDSEQEKAREAARSLANALWDFLSGIQRHHANQECLV